MSNNEALREDLFIKRELKFEGELWEYSASRLAGPGGINTLLRKVNTNYGSTIWVDWHDILLAPDKSRINILVGLFTQPDKDFRRSPTKSLLRTNDIIKSIAIYDQLLMRDRKSTYQNHEIEDMIAKGHLPRPEVVFIDADRPLLDKFFQERGFKQTGEYDPHAYTIPWNRLVTMATEGELPLF